MAMAACLACRLRGTCWVVLPSSWARLYSPPPLTPLASRSGRRRRRLRSPSFHLAMVSFHLLTATTAALCCVAAPWSPKTDQLAVRPRTPDLVSDKTVVLEKLDLTSKASRSHLRQLRQESTRLGKRAAQMSIYETLNDVFFQGYTSGVNIDGQRIQIIVETDSSDLWVATDRLTCVDKAGNATDRSDCGFGQDLFKGTPSGGYSENQTFSVAYHDGEFADGTPAVAKVEIAGIDIDQQAIGLVNRSYWHGDNKTSGLLGLGYPILTSAYYGNNASQFDASHKVNQTTIVQNMAKKDASYSSFSIAQERKNQTWHDWAYLSWGGLAPVQSDGKFASAPIRTTKYYSQTNRDDYRDYAITPDAYDYDGYHRPNTNNTAAVRDEKMEDVVMVDIGLLPMLLHSEIVANVSRLFDPPAVMNSDNGVYYAPCNATAPKFAVKIGGLTFPVSKDNMLIQDTTGEGGTYTNKTTGLNMCLSALQDAGTRPPFILGNAFLKNVVSVYDIGAAEMRFAAIPELTV